jgi:hypothetical protein
MFSTLEVILYIFLPIYAVMFAGAYLVYRKNREGVLSLLPEKTTVMTDAPLSLVDWLMPILKGYALLVLFIALLPLLLLLAGFSYPYGGIGVLLNRYQERQFLKKLKLMGRTVSWEETRRKLQGPQPGTLLGEALSMHGPWRLWWTPDAIATISPFPFHMSQGEGNKKGDERFAWLDEKFIPFGEWCRTRYTSETSGSATLVDPGTLERKSLLEEAKRIGFLCVSWRRPRPN